MEVRAAAHPQTRQDRTDGIKVDVLVRIEILPRIKAIVVGERGDLVGDSLKNNLFLSVNSKGQMTRCGK
jgi:hypothetical protein